MALLRTLRNAFQSWRRRRGGPRTRQQRTAIAMEQLDHRRLLSVNFTGNAVIDIPDSTAPGTAIIRDDTSVPIRNPQLAQLIKVSGFDISAIRMKYTPEDDVLSVALEQPPNQKTTPEYPVIAGDADNNGDGGTVAPAVRLVQPLFMDFADLGGSETMAVFFDFNGDQVPDVVAGIPNTPGAGKFFTVSEADANSNQGSTNAPAFGTPLPTHTGDAFLRDTDPAHGAFEFQITHFSELYQEQTGQPLKTDSIIGVGAFAGSNDDFIDEEFVPARPVSFGVIPPTPPPMVCPPLSPPVRINPHENRHVNTAHPDYVRVSIFGTSGFDVNRIQPETVRLGGAAPIAHFTRKINRDEFRDVTYVFRGDQIGLPPGIIEAHVTGKYVADTGQVVDFDTAQTIFNKTYASYGPGEINAQQRRQAIRGVAPNFPPGYIARRARQNGVDLVIDQLQNESAQPWNAHGRPLVNLPTGGAVQAVRRAGHAVRIASDPATNLQAPSTRVRPRAPAAPAAAHASAATIPNPTLGPSAVQNRSMNRLDQSDYLNDLATSLAV